MTLTNLAVCEALIFAQKSGVDPARMLEALSAGAAGSWQLSNLGPKMLRRDFAPGFKVRLQRKDLRLALESAQQMAAALPGLALVSQLFSAVEAAGCGEEGTQALIKALEQLNGVQVKSATPVAVWGRRQRRRHHGTCPEVGRLGKAGGGSGSGAPSPPRASAAAMASPSST